jgi:hypothetical protein
MSYQAVIKRMKSSPEFKNKVETIQNEALMKWEQIGIEALMTKDDSFNVPLFKMYASSKRSFQTYDALEVEKRLEALEDAHNGKQ